MSGPTKQHRDASSARRVRYGLSTGIILAAVTASCLIAGALASKWNFRIDVTATREHTLSPRTRSLVASLGEPVEIVIAADESTLDPRAALRLNDVLDGLEHATDRLSVTRIDLSGSSGRRDFTALVGRLADSIGPRVSQQEATLTNAIGATRNAISTLQSISAGILQQRQTLGAEDQAGQSLERIAAAARLLADSIDDAIGQGEGALAQRIGGGELASVDTSSIAIASTQRALLADLDSLDAALSSVSLGIADRVDLGDAADALLALRDSVARSLDSVDRLRSIQTLAALRTIESGPCAVVISGERARAVPMQALFPPSSLIDASGSGAADLRFVGESLLAAAIGSLTGGQHAPIVVLVHGAADRQLDSEGRALTPDAERAFGSLLESLRLRDIRVAEWAPGTGAPRPTFQTTGEDGRELAPRPVVWVTFPVSIRSSEGAERMARHAGAIQGLIESGENVLCSFDASTLPSVGEPDPMAQPLEPLGIRVRTGAAMLRRVNTPSGAIVDGQFILRSADPDNPIGRAINGLATRLAWPCPIETTPTNGVTAQPILTIPPSATTWGELEWMAFRSLSPAQRAMLADAPGPDEGVDLVGGPWDVAIAAERAAPDGAANTQRLVVVGANGWFTDVITRESASVDGRTVSANPGNAELFDAAVAWLAHQDDAIAAGPGATGTPRLPAMDRGFLAALRWGIIAGLPLLTLTIGVVVRLWKG